MLNSLNLNKQRQAEMEINENRTIYNDTVYDFNLTLSTFESYCLAKVFNNSLKLFDSQQLTKLHAPTFFQWYNVLSSNLTATNIKINMNHIQNKDDFYVNHVEATEIFKKTRLVVSSKELAITIQFLNAIQSAEVIKQVTGLGLSDFNPIFLSDLMLVITQFNSKLKELDQI